MQRLHQSLWQDKKMKCEISRKIIADALGIQESDVKAGMRVDTLDVSDTELTELPERLRVRKLNVSHTLITELQALSDV